MNDPTDPSDPAYWQQAFGQNAVGGYGSINPALADAELERQTRFNPKTPHSTFGKALDYLSRPLYAVTGAADELLQGLGSHDTPGRILGDVLKRVGREFTSRTTRTSGFELIQSLAPQWAAEHPILGKTYGFAAEAIVDPLNLLGTAPFIKLTNAAGKVLRLGKSSKLLGALESFADDTLHLYEDSRQLAREDFFKHVGEIMDPSLPSSGSKEFERVAQLRAERRSNVGLDKLEEEYPNVVPAYSGVNRDLPQALRSELRAGSPAQEAERLKHITTIPKTETAVEGLHRGVNVTHTQEGIVVTFAQQDGRRDVEILLQPDRVAGGAPREHSRNAKLVVSEKGMETLRTGTQSQRDSIRKILDRMDDPELAGDVGLLSSVEKLKKAGILEEVRAPSSVFPARPPAQIGGGQEALFGGPQDEWLIAEIRMREGYKGNAEYAFDRMLKVLAKDPDLGPAIKRFSPVERTSEETLAIRKARGDKALGGKAEVEEAIAYAPAPFKRAYQKNLVEQAMKDGTPVGESAYRAVREQATIKEVRKELNAEYRGVVQRRKMVAAKLAEFGITPEDLKKMSPKWGIGIGQHRIDLVSAAVGLTDAAKAVARVIPGVKALEEATATTRAAIRGVTNRVGKNLGALFSRRAQFTLEAREANAKGSFDQLQGIVRRLEQALATGVGLGTKVGREGELIGLGQGGIRERAARGLIDMFGGSDKLGKVTAERQKVMMEAMFAADRRLGAAVNAAKEEKAALHGLPIDRVNVKPEDLSKEAFGDAIAQAFGDAGLTIEERGVLAEFYQLRRDVGGIQLGADLVRDVLQAESLAPGFFGDAARLSEKTRRGKANKLLDAVRHQDPEAALREVGLDDWLDKSLADRFEKAGVDLGTSAVKVMLLRMTDALRTEQLELSRAAIVETFGRDLLGHQRDAKSGLASVRGLFKDLGYWQFKDEPASAFRNALKAYDGVLGLFRKTATVLRPAFAFRQLVGNGIQQAARGSFSTAGYAAATRYLATGEFGVFTGALGREVRSADLVRWQREFPILRGITTEGLTGSTAPTRYELILGERWRELSTRDFGNHSKDMLMRLSRYTNWPGLVEDHARLAGFLTNISKGMTPRQAFDTMEDALFDYTTGLTQFERDVMRRLIPFYSFQKFALGLLGKVGYQSPGRLVNMQRAWAPIESAWGKLWGGEEGDLTATERRVIPGYLLEQPSAFAGFSANMKARFNTFRGFHFGDVLDVLRLGPDGQVDIQETMQAGWFAQMSPAIKMPLEFALNRELFTGRSLERGRKIGPADPNVVLTGLAGSLVAALGGTAATETGGALFAGLSAATDGYFLPDEAAESVMRKVLGWEEAVDPETQERTVYISPWRALFFSNLYPPLSEVIYLSREDRSPVQRTLRLLGGVGVSEVDLARSRRFIIKDLVEEGTNAKTDLKRYLMERRESSAEKARQDLLDVYSQLSVDLPSLAGSVRGATYSPPEPPGSR